MEYLVNMFKIFGSLLVILSCSGIGFYIAQGFVNRTKEIRQLQNIVSYIETEIIYGHTPLLNIVQSITEREKGSIHHIFVALTESVKQNEKSFSLCWQEAFAALGKSTSLKTPELRVMQQLGSILGQSDRESQQKHLRIAFTHLQTEEQDAHDLQKRYEKLSRTLGVLTGLLFVILFF